MDPKIIISDCDHSNINMERSVFEKANESFILKQCHSSEEVAKECQGAVVLINQYAPLDRSVFEAIPSLKCVVRYGVGVDNVNVEDATKYGVQVCNVPDYGMNEVADHAMALLLALYRNVWLLGNETKSNSWDYSHGPKIHRPETQTLGIIGTGRIGREMAKRAHVFGFSVLGYDEFYVEHTTPEERLSFITYVDSLEDLLTQSNIISLHSGLNESNYHMMNKKTFSQMKDHAYLINVSRGGLIDEEALNEALNSGKLAGAGLDVFNHEPLPANSPLFSQPNCIVTPHSAWYSEEAFLQLKHDVAALAVAFLGGNIREERYLKNRVNFK